MASGQIRQVPISAVANFKNSAAFGSINRKDLNTVITIFSNVLEGYDANQINSEIKDIIESYELPNGYEVKQTGEQEKQNKEMAFLSGALLIALFLILLIIVGQFNSISSPIIILISVLFSLTGVFLGIVIFKLNFVIIMTMIGIISLAGVVVNNAIVLIDYTNLLEARRREELGGAALTNEDLVNALVKAGKTRLRPVLLTAITTVLGLVPLAIGFNIDFFGMFSKYDPDIFMGGDSVIFWAPMCWTIIFGITFATFLTLVIVPVMYLLVSKFKVWLRKKIS